jgi:hypothetical protein
MKKQKRKLKLDQSTIKKLVAKDLEFVAGGALHVGGRNPTPPRPRPPA